MKKQFLIGILSALLLFCIGYVESAFALSPNLRQVVLAPSLEQQVKAILKRSGGSLYLPSPATTFQDSAGTIPGAVDAPVGKLLDLISTNHATQATAGFKPILRGKVKNWLLNSAILSTQSVALAVSGLTWTLTFKGTGTVTLSGGYTGELVGTGANDRVSLTFTTTAATNVTYTVTGTVEEAQAELGSVANSYVATTSAPASSSYRPYWLDFDGVNDYMVTSGWSAIAPTGGNPSVLLGVGRSNKTTRGDIISYGNSGGVEAAFRSRGLSWFQANDARSFASTDTSVSTNTSNLHVLTEVVTNATTVKLRKNGVVIGVSAGLVSEDTPASELYIGATNPPGTKFYAGGGISGIAAIPATLSEKDLYLLEKYLARLAGISI
jgi:hypothetical protein